MKERTLIEVLKENNEFKKSINSKLKKPITISLLSNNIINQIQPVLENWAYSIDLTPIINFGEFDNIVQDSNIYSSSDVVIIFWELNNIVDGFQYSSTKLTANQIKEYLEKVKTEIKFCINSLSKTSLVLFNNFSSNPFSLNNSQTDNYEKIGLELNNFVNKILPDNFKLVNIDKIISCISIEKSYNMRNFYTSKSPYSFDFFSNYLNYISPILSAKIGATKKVLVLDCDNTLWGGILGEDGINGVKCDDMSGAGKVFYEIQELIVQLIKKGVIVCLNSKNNLKDVEEVFNKKSMPLNYDDIIIKKVNWVNKASNLIDISNELNVGIESLVFIDDSDFEINLIKESLPTVKTMQVPKDIYKYPLEFRKLTNVFTRLNSSKEDKLKTQMYKDELKRNDTKNTYKNINEYITSLNLKMSISINDLEIIERISQMTQKTNQFNATTIRLTKNEVNDFIKSINNFVLSFTLSDKFGKFGVSGCAFIEVIGEDAFVRNILLSCRVLGRTSEDVFVKEIFIFLKKLNIKTCYFDYIKSPKNSQVRSFFNKMSFKLVKDNAKSDLYSLDLEKYIIINTKTIKFDYEK